MSDFGAAGLPALAQRSVRDLVLAGRAAIDEAGSFDQVREIAAKADALRAYQRSIGASQVALNAAGELKLRAERRMGEALAEAPKATGGDRAGRAPIGGNRQIPPITPPTLAEIGVTKVQSSRYQHIAAIPADTFDAAIEAHNRVGEPISAAGVARVADAMGWRQRPSRSAR